MQNYSPSFVNYISMYVGVCEHYARRWKNFKNSMNKFVKQNLKVSAAPMVERGKVCGVVWCVLVKQMCAAGGWN
jgi:hypothetical protein